MKFELPFVNEKVTNPSHNLIVVGTKNEWDTRLLQLMWDLPQTLYGYCMQKFKRFHIHCQI